MKFAEIIGQESAKEMVISTIREGRLPHALILKGPPGIGKLPFANAIAQMINCQNPGPADSCGECSNCIRIRKAIHPDVHFVLPIISKTTAGKSATTDEFIGLFREKFVSNPYISLPQWSETLQGENKQLGIHIQEIRDLKRKMSLKAFEARFKVVIVWNAEKINTEAGNAMLKLLEEPPDRTILILTVADPTQLLSTINSRCQRAQLHRVETHILVDWLMKGQGVNTEQARQIAQLAEGSPARASELVNETNKSFSELFRSWLKACYEGNHENINKWVEGLSRESRDFQKLFLTFALQKVRDLMLFLFHAESIALATPEEAEFQNKLTKLVQFGGVNELSRLIEDSLFYISRNANTSIVLVVLSQRIHSVLTGKVLI